MNCPTDQAELKTRTYESDIEVEECPTCAALWLDAGELEKIQASTEHDYSRELSSPPDYVSKAFELARAKSEAQRACPRCHQPMEKKEHGFTSQIQIDTCSACRGVWLDAGELQALEEFFERAKAETGEMRQGFFRSLLNLI